MLLCLAIIEILHLSRFQEFLVKNNDTSSHVVAAPDVPTITTILPVITPDKEAADALAAECALDFKGNKVVLDGLTIAPPQPNAPTVLCYILSVDSLAASIQRVKETWGQSCDGFFVASNATDDSLNAVAIATSSEQNWRNLWEKNREALRYLHDHHISQSYDWIFKADTDSYVIMPNLKAVLAPLNMSRPQLVGHRYVSRKDHSNTSSWKNQAKDDRGVFCAGAGYAFNTAFLNAFMTVIDTPECVLSPGFPEDVGIAKCFASHFPLSPTPTRDDLGRERFHPFPPDYLRTINGTGWWWEHQHPASIGGMPLNGEDGWSRESVLFHGIKDPDFFHYIHQQLVTCRADDKINDALLG